MDSKKDDVNQLKNEYKKYAQAVAKAILEYGGLKIADASTKIYAVQSGDSLWSISKKFGISVEQLKQANNLNSNLLSIGQKLTIPSNGISSNNDTNKYTVKSGDTLYSIAIKYGTSVDDIKKANGLNNNYIFPGQKLIVNNSDYVVKKGDTLYSIALKNNTTVDKIKSLNSLNTNNIVIGQTLKVR